MRHIICVSAFILSVWASSAQAVQIVLYNYTAPVPEFVSTSVSPQNHQEFTASPGTVTVNFSGALDQAQSELKVYDQYNTLVATTPQKPSQNNSSMALTLPQAMLSGSYRVEWSATCNCKAHNTITGTSYFNIY
jgi:methionine-rich copper-binding protein CopC